MIKSTLKKMLIIPGRHGFSAFFIELIKAVVYAGEKSILVFYEKRLEMGVNCVGKLCKNPIHFVCIFIVQRFFWPKISKINGA